jgi:hypothetical protein
MADVTISALPAATSATSLNEIPANQAGTTRKLTVEQVHDSYVLGRDMSTVTINNSATTTSIYSVNIPARALGTNRIARTFILGEYRHTAGTASSGVRIRVGYSTTTMYHETAATPAVSANSRPIWAVFDLVNRNATNAQALGGLIEFGAPGALIGEGDMGTDEIVSATPLRGLAAIDSTSAATFEVFVRLSDASTLMSFNKWYGYTELI